MSELSLQEREAPRTIRCPRCGAHTGHYDLRGQLGDALASREGSKQREEELREALILARGEMHRALLERGSTDGYRASFKRINAALAENGDTGSETQAPRKCGRIMVGYGGEGSHHPTCKLPKGHKGKCSVFVNGDNDE